ncbi:MAG: hypothetical protein HUJ97_09005 [Bacteroidales bacterium]|nr:hypothetical protein [Clostridia bacterium]MCF0180361.1 hypothetical protein [Bacteroidales bacterium]
MNELRIFIDTERKGGNNFIEIVEIHLKDVLVCTFIFQSELVEEYLPIQLEKVLFTKEEFGGYVIEDLYDVESILVEQSIMSNISVWNVLAQEDYFLEKILTGEIEYKIVKN